MWLKINVCLSFAFQLGCVLSGGQAAGGHNVIMGLFDMIKKLNPESRLFGFLAGPHGVYSNNYMEITPEYMHLYRNTGGFDMIRKFSSFSRNSRLLQRGSPWPPQPAPFSSPAGRD